MALRWACWALALGLDLASPWLVARHTAAVPPHPEHLPERFGLFTIILLGEGMASVVHALDHGPQLHGSSVVAALVGAVLSFGLWLLYFDRVKGQGERHIATRWPAGACACGPTAMCRCTWASPVWRPAPWPCRRRGARPWLLARSTSAAWRWRVVGLGLLGRARESARTPEGGTGASARRCALAQPSRARCRAICASTCAGAVPPSVLRALRVPRRLRQSYTSFSIDGIEALQHRQRQLGQVAGVALRGLDGVGHGFVRVAEGQAFFHQVVGQVGGGGVAP